MGAFQVAVCGPRRATPADESAAFEIGQLLADRGAVIICGGGVGVMASVTAGARSRGGVVIGVRPNDSREGAAPDLTATIVTNLGEARNAIIVWSADAVVVVGGSWGTLSELALAKRRGGVPVVSIGGWRIIDADGDEVPGIVHAGSPGEVVELACAAQTSR